MEENEENKLFYDILEYTLWRPPLQVQVQVQVRMQAQVQCALRRIMLRRSAQNSVQIKKLKVENQTSAKCHYILIVFCLFLNSLICHY